MRGVLFPLSAHELSQKIDGRVVGNPEVTIHRLSALPEAACGSLTFLADSRFFAQLKQLDTGVTVLTNSQWVVPDISATFIVVNEPRRAFAQIAKALEPKVSWKGISPQAFIHPTAKIDKNVSIGPYAIVGEKAVIKAGTVIYPSVYIGAQVEIGEDCELHPFVTIVCNTLIGNRVKVFSGTVIGSEGFGFLESGGEFSEVPQIGGVVIEDDVRLGAKCTIDRGTLGNTFIGRGTKLDDQVHVGHNCIVGKNNILCAQVGLAGSSVLKDGVILGGQVGVGDHLTINENAICGGQTGVTRDLPGNEKYFSTPATPLTEALRGVAYVKKIPEILRRLKNIEESTK